MLLAVRFGFTLVSNLNVVGFTVAGFNISLLLILITRFGRWVVAQSFSPGSVSLPMQGYPGPHPSGQ